MSRSKCQGFTIRDHSGEVDACAGFWFKGFEVSFTSIGYSRGSCLNEIVIFDDQGNVVKTFTSKVEDAVNWLIANK